jgi:hypothetical protein
VIKIVYTEADIPPELVERAIFAQSAPNGVALIHALDKAANVLFAYAHERGKDGDWLNQHPIITMYLAQLIHLNSAGHSTLLENHIDAWSLCEKAKALANLPIESSVDEMLRYPVPDGGDDK